MSKTYVITGTSRGIGLEMTRQLLSAGERVIAVARTPEKSTGLQELKERFGSSLAVFAADINSDAQIAEWVRKIDPAQRIDVLINNAGIYGDGEDFEALSFEATLKTIETNAIGPMRVTRALLPWLKKSTSPKVAHITSLMGSIDDNTSGGSYGYRMSKVALNMFHRSFSIDYPSITSLVIHPGWVQTDMGGEEATTPVHESVRGILNVISRATIEDSGKFYDYEGGELPW